MNHDPQALVDGFTVDIHHTEEKLHEVMLAHAELRVAFLKTRAGGGVSPLIGHSFLTRHGAADGLLTTYLGEMISLHGEARKLGQKYFPEVAIGDTSRIPSFTTGEASPPGEAKPLRLVGEA